MKLLKLLLLLSFMRSLSYAGQMPYNYRNSVLLLHFNEGSGDYTYDCTGSTISGILYGGAGTTGWTNGKWSKAIKCDGINDYVNCGLIPSLQISSAMTMGLWVNFISTITTAVGYKFIMALQSWDCVLYIGENSDYIQGNITAGLLNFDVHMTTNRWYFIVLTYDMYGVGDKLRGYIDGVFIKSIATTGVPITTGDTYGCWIGGSDSKYLNAIIEEAFVCSGRAMPSGEIMRYYKEKPRTLKIN